VLASEATFDCELVYVNTRGCQLVWSVCWVTDSSDGGL